MKINTSFLSFLLLIVNTAVSVAQGLSKEDAIKYTLEHNYGITIAKNSVRTAENNAHILNSGYLPSLSANAGALYQTQDTDTSFEGAIDENTGEQRADINIDDAKTNQYNASLNLDYTIFDGFGKYYNYKKLKETYNVTELEARETIENTITQLFSVYYKVAQLTETENTLLDNLSISQERVTRAKYQFEYGQNTKLEILNAQVDVANDSISLLNNRQELKTSKRDLNLIMNQELNNDFVVDTLVQFIPKLSVEEYIQKAEQNNVTLLQNEYNLRLSSYDIKISKSGYIPSVGLFGSYGWNQNRNPSTTFFPGNIQDSYTFQAGVNLSWSIFDGGNTLTNVKNSKIAYENQELLQKKIESEVKTDIANALTNYEVKLDIFNIQEQSVLTNLNNFNRSKERYKLGQITSIEYRQAQINLTNAKANKSLAKYDAKLAEIQLIQLTGQLLNIEF